MQLLTNHLLLCHSDFPFRCGKVQSGLRNFLLRQDEVSGSCSQDYFERRQTADEPHQVSADSPAATCGSQTSAFRATVRLLLNRREKTLRLRQLLRRISGSLLIFYDLDLIALVLGFVVLVLDR